MSEPPAPMEAFGLSRTGPHRPRNEDRFLIRRVGGGTLIAVADGIGGHGGGAEAAEQAVKSLRAFAPGEAPARALLECLLDANRTIHERRECDRNLARMGTTLTAAFAAGNHAWFVHAGDSRLYLLRAGTPDRVTRDHTSLRAMIEAGDLPSALALLRADRDFLEQCLGCPDLEPDAGELDLEAGDVLLVCSDGLYRELGDGALIGALPPEVPLRQGLLELAASALAAGARDNLTLVALRR